MRIGAMVIGGALLLVGNGSSMSKESTSPPKDVPRQVEGGQRVSIVVTGMVKTLGLTWLGWPNAVKEALDGLPGIKKLKVDLKKDRFDIRYDPSKVTVDRMLKAIRALKYDPKTVDPQQGDGAEKTQPSQINPVRLPDRLRKVFEGAKKENRLVLLDFYGPGWITCKQMDTVTYPDPAVKRELSQWTFAKVNVAKEREVAHLFGVEAIPIAIAAKPNGAISGRMPNFVPPKEFTDRLVSIRKAQQDTPASKSSKNEVERPEHPERERPERPLRKGPEAHSRRVTDRPTLPERPETPDRPERTERPSRPERPERPEKLPPWWR